MTSTGSSSRIAAFSRPLASAGVAGATTFRPGTLANQPSKDCECWAVSWLPAPFGRADDHRAADLAAEHRADLGRVVDDLVHRDQDEVEGHDLDDRALPAIAAPTARADEALLADRRVAHAVGAELVQQAGGDLVGAVEDADLLAHQRTRARRARAPRAAPGAAPRGRSSSSSPRSRREPALEDQVVSRTANPGACARTAA